MDLGEGTSLQNTDPAVVRKSHFLFVQKYGGGGQSGNPAEAMGQKKFGLVLIGGTQHGLSATTIPVLVVKKNKS